MKVIDEKGKLFGKINIIDFSVILVLVCALPVFYATSIMINKTSKLKPKEEMIDLELDGQLIKLKPEDAKLISVGDKEIDKSGEVIAQIIKIGEVQPYKYKFDLGAGRVMLQEDPEKKQIDVKLYVKAAIRNDNPYYKEQRISADNALEFITDKYYADFIIPKIKKEKWLSIYIKSYNVIPEIGEIIQVGDTEKDNEGRDIAVLTAIVENKPTAISWSKNKLNRNLNLRFSVFCGIKENEYEYKNTPIKLGNSFNFSNDAYSISGTVTGIDKNEIK